MSNLFDRFVDRVTIKSDRRRVFQASIISLVLFVIMSALFVYGAYYQLELKIRAKGEAIIDNNGNIVLEIEISNEFFDKVMEGQRVSIKKPKIESGYNNFKIAVIYAPEFQSSETFMAVAVPVGSQGVNKFLNEGEKIETEIFYKKARVIQILLKKEI